ncbi:MAG TPA: FGGY-family carbohydrate kinase [Acidimicrobiia bacterium]|jgi:glycerol kinase
MRILVLDVGTSGVRAAIVRDDLRTEHDRYTELLPASPEPGMVEIDAAALASLTLGLARDAVERGGPVDGVAISAQRASTIAWDAASGQPLGPGLGWQDLRTIALCFAAREHGLRPAPNQTATKAQWLLDVYDAGRTRDVRIGTVDTWIAWTLSNGTLHMTDTTNAGVTGLTNHAFGAWDERALGVYGIPRDAMATIVPSAGVVGAASALAGEPPIVAILGDQQASLAGQACVHAGDAKITFGTGAMLDMNLGDTAPPEGHARNRNGTFPIAAWRVGADTTWALESIMLAAGTNVQWLRDDMGLIASSDESDAIASSCADTDGVTYVPALLGLGTPQWDYGARSALLGLTRGTTRAHIVRAVLEGVAQRGADLVDAAIADSGRAINALRIDGGMSDNATFLQALADASGRPVEVSPVREATTRGAALFGLLALGHYRSVGELAATWQPRARVEPANRVDRDRWREAVARAGHWIPALSGIDL